MLNSAQKKHLRGLAMALKPVASVGKGGLSEEVLGTLDTLLSRHELIKVRFEGPAKEDRREIIPVIEEKTGAELAGAVGHTAVFYRYSETASEHVRLPRS